MIDVTPNFVSETRRIRRSTQVKIVPIFTNPDNVKFSNRKNNNLNEIMAQYCPVNIFITCARLEYCFDPIFVDEVRGSKVPFQYRLDYNLDKFRTLYPIDPLHQ